MVKKNEIAHWKNPHTISNSQNIHSLTVQRSGKKHDRCIPPIRKLNKCDFQNNSDPTVSSALAKEKPMPVMNSEIWLEKHTRNYLVSTRVVSQV